MKKLISHIAFLSAIFFISGCNTLYNTRMIDIDILEPARVKLPDGYNNLAVRYNNANVAWNPSTAVYYADGVEMTDSTNLDSLASKVYFDIFVETLKAQQFFDSISVIEEADYLKTQFVDTLSQPLIDFSDSTLSREEYNSKMIAYILAVRIKNTGSPLKVDNRKYLDPEFGLYTKGDISMISDSTSADLLLSFDHFYTRDGFAYFAQDFTAHEAVQVHYIWTAYDLKKKKLAFHFAKADTIFWSETSNSKKTAIENLPPRRDAVLNAADIAGGNTAIFLVPHWTTVNRMYYESGNTEIKPTRELVDQGKWMEAAELWKNNVNNPNKKIAAKCKFNMAVACEMNDQLDAALAWVVESYHVFGEKNEVHAAHCRDYIRILSQRKLDVSIIQKQFESKN